MFGMKQKRVLVAHKAALKLNTEYDAVQECIDVYKECFEHFLIGEKVLVCGQLAYIASIEPGHLRLKKHLWDYEYPYIRVFRHEPNVGFCYEDIKVDAMISIQAAK